MFAVVGGRHVLEISKGVDRRLLSRNRIRQMGLRCCLVILMRMCVRLFEALTAGE